MQGLWSATATWLRRRGQSAPAQAAAPATDSVPGLLPRSAFEQALDEAVHHCDTESTQLAVLYLGLDNFRRLNDTHGQAAGDAVLTQVAARLRQALPGLIGVTRNVGDEFILALPGGAAEARLAAMQLRQALLQPVPLGALALHVDASIGIALYPQHGAARRLLLQSAAAMRAVKRCGGGAHAEFEPSMGVDMRQQAELVQDLRGALDRRELQLVYQPKIDARSLRVTGAEALLRWHDARRGVVSPGVFVPLAEKHGLIDAIGRWVIEEACRQAGAWQSQGLQLNVAVNLSAYQLRQDDLVDHLCGCLQQHGIAPRRFTCEVTESVALEYTRVTRDAFERLHQAGVQLSIDDFGTAQTSLAALRKVPAAELKIDRGFVADLESSADARSVAATVISMAHQLGLRVVAEGVEHDDQRDWLLHMQCNELQGYLFAKPMSATALGVWASGELAPSDLGLRESQYRDTQPQMLAPRAS